VFRLLKIFILLLILFSFTGELHSQQYWLNVPSPTTRWLCSCTFTDTLNGWASGDSGTIIHTTNGGQNWFHQNSNINFFVEDLFFINKRLGWAIANDFIFYRTYVLNTTNGGENWSATQYPDTNIILNTIYFIDSLTGYMGGFNAVILKTTNAGLNWNQMTVDSSFHAYFHIKRFNFFNHQYGFACGGIMDLSGVIWKTTNFGMSWSSKGVGPEPVFDILFLDANKIISTGGDFEYGASIVKSYNSGTNWNYSTIGFFGVGQALAFRTSAEVWVPLGFSLRWAVSSDTGNSWQEIIATDSAAIYDAVFVTPNHGWAVGDRGKILKYNREIIGISKKQPLPVSFKLYQNYPNPFNPVTKIKFEMALNGKSETANVLLIIYDVLGSEVATIVNEPLKPGTYETEWNANSYPSGVYFYKLAADNYSETRRMVLLK
jgi:photosystem II stability/assembly factor-like uncharacterized protein